MNSAIIANYNTTHVSHKTIIVPKRALLQGHIKDRCLLLFLNEWFIETHL